MSELEDSFTKLLGRQPTDTDKQQLYRVRDALGLKSNDALWLVLMALQFYQNQYVSMPEKIAEATQKTLNHVEQTAHTTLKAAAAQTHAELSKAVADSARLVAQNTSRKEMWRWASGCIGVVAITFGLSYWFAFSRGEKAGYDAGYDAGLTQKRDEIAEEKDEKAAASWANTPEGKLAFKLSRSAAGNIASLTYCNQPGWKVEIKGRVSFCYPHASQKGTYGWVIPTPKQHRESPAEFEDQ